MGDLPATLTALGALLTAIFAGTIAYRNSKASSAVREAAAVAAAAATAAQIAAEQAKGAITVVEGKVFEVGKQLDGRLQALLVLTESNALAEGRLQGREAERAGEPEQSAKATNGDKT